MFGPVTVSNDVLDIGTRNAEDKRKQSMASANGTGALCPPKMTFLGEPAAFDVPNVADVSLIILYSNSILYVI